MSAGVNCDIFPANSMVEKMRSDVLGSKASVHYLESRSGVQVGMIGTNPYFIADFWAATTQEKENVAAMLAELLEKTRIFAVPVYGQHHAVAFYVDLQGDGGSPVLITPPRLSKLLSDNEFLRILVAHAKPQWQSSLTEWGSNYIRLHPPNGASEVRKCEGNLGGLGSAAAPVTLGLAIVWLGWQRG